MDNCNFRIMEFADKISENQIDLDHPNRKDTGFLSIDIHHENEKGTKKITAELAT